MKCKLSIFSQGDGWKQNAECEAEASVGENGVVVRYLLDGDNCRLTLSRNSLSQVREGGVNIKISFEEGKTTFCEISDGSSGGGYEVFTEKLSVTLGKHGFYAAADYSGGAVGETISLKIKALYISD